MGKYIEASGKVLYGVIKDILASVTIGNTASGTTATANIHDNYLDTPYGGFAEGDVIITIAAGAAISAGVYITVKYEVSNGDGKWATAKTATYVVSVTDGSAESFKLTING